jgi:dTDP-4-dehydrorhamnose reductase
LLGGRLAQLLSRRHDVIAGRHVGATPDGLESVSLDLRSRDSLARALAASRAEAVLHAAACADADLCEREPDTARELNRVATETLAGLCVERRVRLIALSTDLVLSGERALSGEAQPAAPILEYGRSKLAAEQAVLWASPDFAVLRVALVLGRGFGPRATASEGLLWAWRAGRRTRLFTDQFRTPVDAESVADASARVLEGRGSGLFQIGGPERLNRYELGVRTAAALGQDAGLIDAARQAEQPIGLPRPADCSMDVGRARRELSWQPRPLDRALRESRQAPG